jgi:hypothetical protein
MSERKRRDERHQRRRQSSGGGGGGGGGDSAKDVGAIYLMDLALEKLRLLDYYRHFIVAQNKMRAFTSVEFAVPRQAALHPGGSLSLQQHAEIAVRQGQFSDFLGVCSWLLNSYLACDWKEDDMQTAIENARGLLAALTDEIGLSPGSAAAMTSQAIARGHGHSVCVLLNWILDKVLVQRNMASLPPPDYSTLIGAAEVEEILGGEDDEEDNGGGVAEDDVMGGGLDSDDENTPGGKAWEQTGNKKGRSAGSGENDREEFYLGGIRRGPDADVTAPWDLNALFKLADGEARKRWDIECERVRPKLQAMDKHIKASLSGGTTFNVSAWREHLQIARAHSKRLQDIQQREGASSRNGASDGGGSGSAPSTTKSTVQRFLSAPETMPWARAIMKIQRQEPLLERMYAPIIGEWRDVAKRIEVLQRLVNDRQESVGVSSQKLVEMSEELSMARDNIQRIGEGVSDTSPVQVRSYFC